MTGRSQRGGANAPEERQEGIWSSGEKKNRLTSRVRERRKEVQAFHVALCSCECEPTLLTLFQQKRLQVNNKTLHVNEG